MSRTIIHTWQFTDDNVLVTCPVCKEIYPLDHKIDDAGIITPSLDCPSINCNFHENCQLANWPKDPK